MCVDIHMISFTISVCSAFAPIRSDVADNDAISEEIHNLQMFLGNPQQPHNLIIFHLKTDLQKVKNEAMSGVMWLWMVHVM